MNIVRCVANVINFSEYFVKKRFDTELNVNSTGDTDIISDTYLRGRYGLTLLFNILYSISS